jgi:GR25 family glycosyltransferase involved in LPS biosynthesis
MIIENIFYINLDCRLDKKDFILEQLKNSKAKIQRISGVIINQDEIQSINFVKHLLKEKTSTKELCGIVGVNIAHINALKSILSLNTKENFSLIIEDDVIIDNSFWFYLDSINPYSDTDIVLFDILKTQQVRNRNKNNFIQSYYRFDDCFHRRGLYAGAFCYAVKNKKIKKIINILENKNLKKLGHYDQTLLGIKNIKKDICLCNMINVNFSFGSDRIGILTEQGLVDKNFLA